MIDVLLISALPRQHNDAITFFHLPLYFLRKLVPPLVASVVAEFEQTLRDERFGNVSNQSTGHKLKTVNKYAIDIIS